MSNQKRSRKAQRNPIGLSRMFFWFTLGALVLVFAGAHLIFKQRKVSHENEIAAMRSEMADYRDEIQAQRSLQASLLNHETLRNRLAQMQSVLIEIPVGQVRYVEVQPGNPALRSDDTGLAGR